MANETAIKLIMEMESENLEDLITGEIQINSKLDILMQVWANRDMDDKIFLDSLLAVAQELVIEVCNYTEDASKHITLYEALFELTGDRIKYKI